MSDLFRYNAAPASATVGTSSAVVLAANANRKGAIFVNDSANKIYLAINAAAVSGKGILLTANGGAYEINNTNLTEQAVSAIATGAGSELTILEAEEDVK